MFLAESDFKFKMGMIGTIYANILLSIADVSVRLFAPSPEIIAVPQDGFVKHDAQTSTSTVEAP
jgi:hypothetical protein